MAYPFSPTEVTFGGYGIDDDRTVWTRFWCGPPGSPSVVVPVADINFGCSELWRRFGDRGIVLNPEDKKAILQKVQQFPGSHRFKLVNSLGWSLGYVTPTRVFGAPSELIERDFKNLDFNKYRSAGTLQQWQERILAPCVGNSRLMFAVMCAFVGPLLSILGIPSFGFQLFGESSIGKSIILIVAGSVWGCRVGAGQYRGFPNDWATTLEGVERYAAVANHSFLALDETRLAGTDRDIGKLVPTFIMRLAQGASKNRLVNVGSSFSWQLLYLGASNPPLTAIFAAGGLDFDDAYRVRFPDIPTDAGCGYGAFEDIHDFPEAAAFADELRARACRYFGTASEHYLDRLAYDRRQRLEWLLAGLWLAMARYCAMAPPGSAADRRITQSFAVVYAAALLARHYGILTWSRKQILWAVQRCERAHHQWFAAARAANDPIALVRAYISANLPRFRSIPDPTITKAEFAAAPGFIYAKPGQSTEYPIPRNVFDAAFARSNPERILRALAAAGLLVYSEGRWVSKVPVRSSAVSDREYAYRIRASIL